MYRQADRTPQKFSHSHYLLARQALQDLPAQRALQDPQDLQDLLVQTVVTVQMVLQDLPDQVGLLVV